MVFQVYLVLVSNCICANGRPKHHPSCFYIDRYICSGMDRREYCTTGGGYRIFGASNEPTCDGCRKGMSVTSYLYSVLTHSPHVTYMHAHSVGTKRKRSRS